MKNLILTLVVLASGFANASDYRLLGLNFNVPTVAGVANVADPRLGELVFDSTTASFYGNIDGTTSGWANLGGTGKGTYTTRGVRCTNNTSSPNSQFDMDADSIVLRDSSNNVVVINDPGSAITNDVTTSGPVANGRDQAGSFSASSFVHFYWIWNGTALATLSSTVAPPTGPTLPTGYTHWAYAGAIRFNGSSQLVAMKIVGNSVFYDGRVTFLSSGTATTETAVDISSYIPTNASEVNVSQVLSMTTGGTGQASGTVYLRVSPGNTLVATQFGLTGLSASAGGNIPLTGSAGWLPNVGQNLYYLTTLTNGSSPQLSLFISAYKIPNGD